MRRKHYIALLLIVTALAAYTYTMRYHTVEPPEPPDLDLVPTEVIGYRGVDEFLNEEALLFYGADATLFRTYMREGEPPIWLFIGYFGSQQEYSQIHSPKNCYPGAGWNILREVLLPIEWPAGTIRAKELIISDGTGTHIVVYWFSTPYGALTNEFALKWYQAKRSLARKPQESTFVRFSTPVPKGADESKAEEKLLQFIESIAVPIDSVLTEQAMKGRENGPTA